MTEITNKQHEIMESVISKGDLAKLTADERNRYYMAVCQSLGLNPLTRPFEYITLDHKLVLYARRDAADQLRQIHGIDIEIVGQKMDEGILTVHARAKDKSGRVDEDFGSVNVRGLTGAFLANAMMKAVTKAKRRVTLSIAGLGFPDEEEIDDVPRKRKAPVPAKLELANSEPTSPAVPESPRPAEEAAPPPLGGAATISLEDMAREAAMRGESQFKMFYKGRSDEEKEVLNSMGDELRSLMQADKLPL